MSAGQHQGRRGNGGPVPSKPLAAAKSAILPPPHAHRYRVGDPVTLSRGFGYARVSGAVYEVTHLLPADRTHFHYRIRSEKEAFSRVAAENELTPRVLPQISATEGTGNA